MINKAKPKALSEAALVKFIKEYIKPIKSSKKIELEIKLIFIDKINISKEIKGIIACFLNKNNPVDPIINKVNDKKKYINI